MKLKKYLLLFFFVFPLTFVLGSCNLFEPEPSPENMVLLYFVNNSNLASDFSLNKNQALEAMQSLDCDRNILLVYDYNSTNGSALYRAERVKQRVEYRLVKRYPAGVQSIDSTRIKEVIEDAITEYPCKKRTLFLGGHGFGWWDKDLNKRYPVSDTRGESGDQTQYILKENKSFGGEYNLGGNGTISIDIDRLANAIPKDIFQTIWFDACYMSGIEVAFEFKHHCETLVAYPTEIYGSGIPYNMILPYIFSNDYDVVGAAKCLYNFYNDKQEAVTVAVYDMKNISELATTFRRISAECEFSPNTYQLQNYSRLSMPFYDLREYMHAKCELSNREDLKSIVDGAVGRCIKYSAASRYDFNGRPIKQSTFSGITMHIFQDENSSDALYYRRLKWWQVAWAPLNP